MEPKQYLRRPFASTLSIGACCCFLAACAATTESRQETIRQTADSAPPELQLACANGAKERFPDTGDVLPLNSELLGGDVYRVQLTSRGGSYVCDVRTTGDVVQLLSASDPAASRSTPTGQSS